VSIGDYGKRSATVVGLLVWSLSAAYSWHFVDRGWVPHDEGYAAHAADRVLGGEIPHRDFDAVYTGGLDYIHALAFRLLGVRLTSLRFVALALFLAWLPAFYAVALRLAPPWIAGLVTWLGVAWGLPNYFASVPSWYNLFFATFGTLALIWHLETGRRRWLFVAGALGGLSFLMKQSGLYFVAGVLLFLAYREQELSAREGQPGERRSYAFLAAYGLGLSILVVLLVFLVGPRPAPMEVLHFIIPGAALGTIVLWNEARVRRGGFVSRLRRLLYLVTPFGLGVVIPLALFLFPYVWSHATLQLYKDVFLRAQRRLAMARMPLPPASTLVAALPYSLLLALPRGLPTRRERLAALALGLALCVVLIGSGNTTVYRLIWDSARSLAVIVVVGGCLVLRHNSVPAQKRQILFLLISVVAMVSLIQFPFSAPIYFCYVAPLVALALLATVTFQDAPPKLLHGCALGFYLLFAVLRMNTGYIWDLGRRYTPYDPTAVLALERGGIKVPSDDKLYYEELVALVQAKRNGPYIYAGRDCPEVYFLSGSRNPGRKTFAFLGNPVEPAGRVLQLLEDKAVSVAVINQSPSFSPTLAPRTRAGFRGRFPQSARLGQFVLRWRGEPAVVPSEVADAARRPTGVRASGALRGTPAEPKAPSAAAEVSPAILAAQENETRELSGQKGGEVTAREESQGSGTAAAAESQERGSEQVAPIEGGAPDPASRRDPTPSKDIPLREPKTKLRGEQRAERAPIPSLGAKRQPLPKKERQKK